MMDERQIGSPGLVSIVMRTVGGRPREIRRAVASIAANKWRPLEVVIVYQGPDGERWGDVQNLVTEFPALPVHVVRNNESGDRRAENLNIGWEAAQGQYLGFLDDDDTLEPDHFELLLRAIRDTGRTWAYAQVVLRKENEALKLISESRPFRRHAFSLKTLWDENFIPIHSFVIDRMRLHGSLQSKPFCEELNRSEDWDFLLRLAFYHEPAVLEEFTAAYYVSTNARNTNLSLTGEAGDGERERSNRDAWQRCKLLVDQRKGELIQQMWWANSFFASETLLRPQEASSKQSGGRMLHQRVIRRLIRVLEQWL